MKAPRKPATLPPRKVVAWWGDDATTRREWDPSQLQPLTDQELWAACEAYFPKELLPRAAARLFELDEAWRHFTEVPNPPGRPAGSSIGAEVEVLINWPRQLDVRQARLLVARRHHKTYGQVADLHQRWRRLHKGGEESI